MAKLSDYIKLQPKQEEAAKYIGKGNIIFFGGSRGGGKTHLALASAVIACRRHPKIRVIITRATMPELTENFIVPLTSIYPETIFGYKYYTQEKIAKFNNGSRIVFKSIENARDAEKVQGIETQFLILDEGPNFDEYTIQKLFGSVRKPINGFIPTILITGNPGGRSDRYFKTRFIRPDYSVWTEGELEQKDKYVFVESNVHDNKYLGEEYHRMLKSLPEHLYEAWYKGNWDVFEGQFFNFSMFTHVCEPFEIPSHWRRVVGFDLGFTEAHPSVGLWLAQDPSTEIVYVYREYAAHGSVDKYVYDIASMIEEDEVVFCDPSMFTNNKKHEHDESPARMMQLAGIPVIGANNDRINGWRVVKSWLSGYLKVFDTCPGLITTLPILRYTPYNRGKKEDLDTNMPDDYADALRYALMSGFGYPLSSHDVTEPVISRVYDNYDREEENTQTSYYAFY